MGKKQESRVNFCTIRHYEVRSNPQHTESCAWIDDGNRINVRPLIAAGA